MAGFDKGGLIALSVRRPVLVTVVNLLILIAGAAALLGVDIRELPEVDRPIITVRTTYTGAAPETVDAQVTSVVEGAVARVSGVASISSSSSSGSSRVTIEFLPSVDLEAAANDVRDAVGAAQRRLPDGADEPIVVKADSDGEAIMRLAVTSDTLPIEMLTQLVNDQVIDRLAALPGVADVTMFGARDSEIAISIDPVALASHRLTLADVVSTLQTAGADMPAGTLRTTSQNLIVRANATATTEQEIAALVVGNGTRIGDVATVMMRPALGSSSIRHNGQTGIGLQIVRQAQSNALEISSVVRETVAELNQRLSGVEIRVTSDDATFISGAIAEVVTTLVIAVLVVVAVIFVFLRSGFATLIPTISIPVAIIGTIAGIWLLGFSVNLLTLLALVLATGMVVDDAIVVLENIQRRRAEGMGARAAALLGTRQVFFAVLATSATLIAVFVPISFMPGTAGGLFTEFGFVMALAVALSSVVALTLTPMLASRLPASPAPGTGRRFDPIGGFGRKAAGFYRWTLKRALAIPLVVLALALVFTVFAVNIYRGLPQQLLPQEDRGMVLISMSAPQGAALEYTQAQVRRVEEAVRPIIDSGVATDMFLISGFGGGSSGFLIMTLAHWDDRTVTQQEVMADVLRRISGIPTLSISVRGANSLNIRGGGSGLRFALTGSQYDTIAAAGDELLNAMQERLPGLVNPSLSYSTTQPQLSVEIDREAAALLGVPVNTLQPVFQALIESREVAEVFIGDMAVPIVLEAAGGTIDDPSDLEGLFMTNSRGEMLPLSALVTLREESIAPSLPRELLQRAVPMGGSLAEGYALGQAVEDVRALAADVLPPGIGIVFLGDAAELIKTSSGVLLVFGFAFLVVLLVLAAQFESFVSAAIIVFTVPFGLGAAIMAMWLTGGSMNIYSQIGFVILIGLMAKNGILIVEFANQLRDEGRSVAEAIEEACAVRLRPVMMTMISTVLGALPLVLSSGPGAEARWELGWVILGGLGVATIFTLYLTPVAYRLFAGISRPRAAEAQQLEAELEALRLQAARTPAE